MSRKQKNLFQIIVSKKTTGAFLLLVQIAIIASAFLWLKEYISYFYGLSSLLTACLLIYEVNRVENASFKLSWVILIAVIPVFGALLYLFIHTEWLSGSIKKKLDAIIQKTGKQLPQDPSVTDTLREDGAATGFARYLQKTVGYPIYQNTEVTFFPLGEDKFEALLTQLEQAQHFIFLEYFIIAKGHMWDSILDVLKHKVAQGVEVRMMYDGMGCLGLLPQGYPKKMAELGIQCKIFSPIRPFLSTYQNNRDHRKIIVIDGRVAFTGGINLADEYINHTVRFGHWKDQAIMLQGDAVKSFTVMFLQLWNTTEKESEPFEPYLQPDGFEKINHSGYVLPYGDSPLDQEFVGKQVYMDILNTATKYVHITTPYLIPDDELCNALRYAAKRGVDVKLILPHIPDKRYAFALSRTYYPELIAAGVNIYEYLPGFMHAKTTVSDDDKAVVGTINYDFRSLFLHYECAAYLYRHEVIAHIEQDFQQCLKQCMRVSLEDYKKIPLGMRLFGRVLRLFAPLM